MKYEIGDIVKIKNSAVGWEPEVVGKEYVYSDESTIYQGAGSTTVKYCVDQYPRDFELVLRPKPREHAELIKKWADGAKIECLNILNNTWRYEAYPAWRSNGVYRIMTDSSPKTSLSEAQLEEYYESYSGYDLGPLVNYAIDHYLKEHGIEQKV